MLPEEVVFGEPLRPGSIPRSRLGLWRLGGFGRAFVGWAESGGVFGAGEDAAAGARCFALSGRRCLRRAVSAGFTLLVGKEIVNACAHRVCHAWL